MEMDITNLLIPEDEAKIVKSLNLDLDKLNHYDNLFAQWIASQKHLPQIANSTCRKKFLIWAKLDFEKAKKKFVKYCYNPLTHKEFVCDRVISLEGDLKAFNFGYIFSMPKLTPEGYRINIFRIFDPESYNSFLIARYGILHCDYKLHKDCLVAGEIGIFDLENFKPVHYAKMFDVTSLKSIIFASTYPFLIKHSFVMNCHPLLENGITLCKSMLPKKIADRISMVTLQNITDFVQPEYLPDDYGGTQRSLEYLKDAWIKEFVKEKDFLVGIGEGKPTGPMPKELETYDNEFGIDGSFRKLNID